MKLNMFWTNQYSIMYKRSIGDKIHTLKNSWTYFLVCKKQYLLIFFKVGLKLYQTI